MELNPKLKSPGDEPGFSSDLTEIEELIEEECDRPGNPSGGMFLFTQLEYDGVLDPDR